MSGYLVIVESPAKAKTIGRILGKKYKVEASVGHLRDLPVSKLAIDIEHDFKPQYMNIRGKGDLIKALKKDAKEADRVFLATDPDREGEAISWHLSKILDIDENAVCRVTFNEVTKNAVTEAFKEPRKIDMELVDAYQARRVLDRLVGYSISPVLWKKVKKGLSAGRVQSVATRLVCDREDEIENFVPQEYWTITAELLKDSNTNKALKSNRFTAKYFGENGKKHQLKTKEEADQVYQDVLGKDFIVASVKTTEKKKSPPPPFITSTLQQEASRKLGFTASKTMSVVQSLYEGVSVGSGGPTGLVTYIRTDSTRISDEAAAAAKEEILREFGETYLPARRRIYQNKNAAQDAHEAIRPAHIEYKPADIKEKLTSDQYKLYKLIYERFIASQMADAIYSVCTVEFDVSGHTFRAVGTTVKFAGYTKLYQETMDEKAEDADDKLPYLEQGERVIVEAIKPEQHFTQPPPRYTEATLVKALEENGIGRPSTYAPTVSVIQARGYVGKEKKALYPTELGRIVNEIMKKSFSDIVNVEFTAQMEENLDKIEQGNKVWVDVVREFYGDFEKEVEKATQELEHVKLEDPASDVPCDKCGKMMVIKTGKYGKFLACPGYPECKNTKPIIEEVGADCPLCGNALIYRKTKTGKKYVACSNYPDCKFSSWNIPTKDPCPKCGQYLEIAQGKKGKYLKCSNKECDYTSFFKKSKSE